MVTPGLYQELSNQKCTCSIFIVIRHGIGITKLHCVCFYLEQRCSAEKCIGACSGNGCPKSSDFWYKYFTDGSFCSAPHKKTTKQNKKKNRISQFSLSYRLWVQSMLVYCIMSRSSVIHSAQTTAVWNHLNPSRYIPGFLKFKL